MSQRCIAFAVLIYCAAVLPAAAACPAPVAGDTPEAVRANQERLVCLQRQLTDQGDRNATKFEIDQLGRSIDRIDLQRRFDTLNFTPPTPAPF
ncbi:hypothetical protein [Devosia crocina]|uniref:hypothetical protein n=1 Tax=Devosia crocina TaxID=429728 RepID=UPI000B81C8EE|nr:hypothetical protein [Devosia crocina]